MGERWLPHGARCEAVVTFPDDNTSSCGEYANRRARDNEGRERYVCHRHGHDLPDIDDEAI